MGCPRPEGGPGTSGMGPRPLLPPLPPFTPASAGSSSSPAEGPGLGLSRPLGNARAALAYSGSAGYSSPSGEWWVWQQLEGCGADVGLHFPPGHLFSSGGKKPRLLLVPPPPALPAALPPSPCFRLWAGAGWGDSRCAGARRGGGGGRRSGRWRQPPARPGRASCGLSGGTSAGLGGEVGWGYPGAGRLAASGEEEPPGARPVCLRLDGVPARPCRETSPAPTGSLPDSLTGSPSLQAGNATVFCFVLISNKEAPGPHSLSGVGVDVCIGGGGQEISPSRHDLRSHRRGYLTAK